MEGRSLLLVCVNYNSYEELDMYIDSIIGSYRSTGPENEIDLLIADNSEVTRKLDYSEIPGISIRQVPCKTNRGYLGGVKNALDVTGISPDRYDFFIISNVDLILSDTFFRDLFRLNISSNTGWVAPAIMSKQENRDRNPKILKRPSGKKMKITAFMYRMPVLHLLYSKVIYPRRKRGTGSSDDRKIYAGHGSFILFTKAFTRTKPDLNYPIFLFGEEIYFAEQLKRAGLETMYFPELLVHDLDHINTGTMNRPEYYRMNYQAIKYLIQNYF